MEIMAFDIADELETAQTVTHNLIKMKYKTNTLCICIYSANSNIHLDRTVCGNKQTSWKYTKTA